MGSNRAAPDSCPKYDFCRFADVVAFLQEARGATFAIAVGHIAAEDDLRFTDKIQNFEVQCLSVRGIN